MSSWWPLCLWKRQSCLIGRAKELNINEKGKVVYRNYNLSVFEQNIKQKIRNVSRPFWFQNCANKLA